MMTVHAHPDDESSKGASTVARYRSEGVDTALVCCTGGEAGDVLNPALDTANVRDNLAAVRRAELERARRLLSRGEDPSVVLEARAHALTAKFLHGPTALLQRPGPEQQQIGALIDRLLPDEPS